MKIISHENGITGIQVVPDEVKPINGIHIPEVIREISGRYALERLPTLEQATTSGAVFRDGKFQDINIKEFGMYNDSLSITTTDTGTAEVVLVDAVSWLKERFGYRDPVTPPIRAFHSELIVQFQNDHEKLFDRFAPVWQLLQKEFAEVNGVKKVARLNRLDFAADPLEGGAGNMSFLIERRAQAPYSQNRYFTRAYLPTKAHVRVLALFDKLAG